MRLSETQGNARPVRAGLAERIRGVFGAAVIGLTLFGVFIWACVTRTPYYKD